MSRLYKEKLWKKNLVSHFLGLRQLTTLRDRKNLFVWAADNTFCLSMTHILHMRNNNFASKIYFYNTVSRNWHKQYCWYPNQWFEILDFWFIIILCVTVLLFWSTSAFILYAKKQQEVWQHFCLINVWASVTVSHYFSDFCST